MEAAVDEESIMEHVTDLQQPPAEVLTPDGAVAAAPLHNGEVPLSPTSPSAALSEAQLEAAASMAEMDSASGPAAAASDSMATGLANPAAKRRRYRSLFGNIGKLITFSRRRQEQPASPGAATEGAQLQAESELPFPAAEAVSLDLVVPEAEALSADSQDQITGQLELLESVDIAPATSLVVEETTEESSDTATGELAETLLEEKVPAEEKKEGEKSEATESLDDSLENSEAEAKEKKKMEYDMSRGGISTIMEETEEAVKAQDGGLLSEADLVQLESEIDLADYDSQKPIHKTVLEKEFGERKDVLLAKEASEAKSESEGKPNRVAVLQNQISESDSGYGYSTSDSTVAEAEADKSEKPQTHNDEVEGSSGGSDVFSKDIEDSQHGKLAMKSDVLISPSDEELASFEKAEVSVEDSMVDLGDINVKLDSLIESNSQDRSSYSEKPVTKPEFGRVSESLEDEDDEEMEPVELDLSSNQSVRRRQILEAKARRQRELEAARRQQEEALSCLTPAEECKHESPVPESPVKDKDIVDGLGPRRHSHENNSSAEGCTEGGRSRMRSRLPVKRSASCPRRTVEEYSTYIRSGSAAKKPISHLIESGYSPVKIDFKPLSRVSQEAHGEQLTAGPQPGAINDSKSSQPSSKRGSKKVHFNSPTVDQVVTYTTVEIDEMKHRDCEEMVQHQQQKAKQAASVRPARQKPADAEKLAAQQDEECNELEILPASETIVARSPIYNCAKSWIRVSLDNSSTNAKDRSVIKSISVKQTLASRKRLEKLHEDAVKLLGLQDESQYMTPLQRKDLEVKELKRQLDEAYFIIEQRELELDVFHHEKTKSIEDAVKDREERIACLQVQINQLESDFSSLRTQHSEMCSREKSLAETLEQLKAECAERERRHQDLYLEMYRKGRDSARFERQDEIEKLAVLEPDKVAMEELLEKLEITQHDLQKWQSIKLKEVYEDSDKASTEADAKLRFLRDSMFHYLTEKDREQNQQHLMAMIGIFSFTDVQMKHIMKSLDERRRKGKI